MSIGILALQGDFARHEQSIRNAGEQAILVRTSEDLHKSDGLIIPGGESTTLTNLLNKHGLWDEIAAFAIEKPVFGTCAGLIVLAAKVNKNHLRTLGLIDIEVDRNAYGRQVDSFIDNVQIQLSGHMQTVEGVFIRAPKIIHIGASVTPLGWHKQDVVMAESGNILVAAFHPELTNSSIIHNYFLSKIKNVFV
jgi:pyridoxal 5'-phosphate synthase pdxT subunit